MGWSGGTFTRVHDWTTDEGSAIDIEADRMDAEDDNFAAGINACIHKGGTNNPTANLPMGGYRHTGVDDAIDLTDYTSAKDVMNQNIVWGTLVGTNAKTCNLLPAPAAYQTGQKFCLKNNSNNTDDVTLNLNSLGAKSVVTIYGRELHPGEIVANKPYEFVYDDTQFIILNPSISAFNKRKTADQSITSDDTLTSDTHLTGWEIKATEYYRFNLYLYYIQNGGDIKFRLSASSAPQRLTAHVVASDAFGTTTETEFQDNFSSAVALTDMTDSATSWIGVHIRGIIQGHATADATIELQWAQNTSNANATTLKEDSFGTIEPIEF